MTTTRPTSTPAGGVRRWWYRAVVILAAVFVAWLPTSPAAADPGDAMCYVGSGKPYVEQPAPGGPGTGAPLPPTSPIVPCDQLTSYTKPGTFFGGGSTVIDRQGNPLDSYYFDSGYHGMTDSLTHGDVKLATMVADWIFSLNSMIVWVACWLLGVSVNFGVADAMLGPVAQIAQKYQTQVVDRFGLPTLALMLCVFWFGFAALRGRVGKGAGEILISFCLAAVSGVVLAAPADTVLGDDGLLGGTRDVGITFAALPLDDTGPATNTGHLTPDNIITPFQNAIIDTFVRQPHEQLAYGVIFDDTGDGAHPCLDTYNKILKAEHADDESPMYDLMKQCDPRLAEHLRQDTGTRIVGSILVLIGSLIMLTYVVIGVVIPLLGGQIALAVLAILLVLALPASLLGGPGRRALWLWVGSTATVLAAIVIGFGSLSFFLVTTGALTGVQGTGFLLRLLLVDIVAVILLACHRRIGQSTRSHVRFAVRRLDRAKVGGSGMGGMGMGGRGWSVRGVWRDVQTLDANAGRAFQRVQILGREFRRGFTGEDRDDAGYQRDPFPVERRPASRGTCPTCGGEGTISVYLESADDFEDRECPTCGGSGNA
ncbi:hypothetical protein [Krasilnikovia sp. MM14-A1259]|uniref:hypothetical protein n=1 Tax=Krasilnikovia sp. MM14-A1259 TaxID=3373539 RepID=UPI00399CBD58